MAFTVAGDVLLGQNIADISTTKKHQLGTIVQAFDPVLGMGEFIYLKGVASTVVGSGVTYDDSFQTALASIAVKVPRPLAIAMGACVATYYGWYQIGGIAVVAKANTTSFAKGAALGITSGLAVAAASGLVVQNALVAVVASAKSDVTSVKVAVNRPGAPIT
jgi:hypothetical protein